MLGVNRGEWRDDDEYGRDGGRCGQWASLSINPRLSVYADDIGPLINLGTQHDGRSARTWMKRVLTTFVSLWEGEKDLLESTKIDFYET